MRHRTKTLQKVDWVTLIKSVNPKTGRFHYIVQVDVYLFNRITPIAGSAANRVDSLREHFDPHHTRGGRWTTKWKYRNRAEAEQLITMALLKFGV